MATAKRVFALTLVALLLLVPSCSPTVRLRVTFSLPTGVKPDAARLRVTLTSTCERYRSGKALLAPAVATPGPKGVLGASLEGERLVFPATRHAGRCLFQLAAWFDTNGNGKVDRGDATGRFPTAVEAVDRGLCAGNLTEVTVAMKPVR